MIKIKPNIKNTPKNILPTPIQSDRQLAVKIHRFVHGCSFTVLNEIFGISKSLPVDIFDHDTREFVTNLYNGFVKLPTTENEWVKETIEFIENYEFSCIGSWDWFHMFTAVKLKNYYNFKNRYSNSNMRL